MGKVFPYVAFTAVGLAAIAAGDVLDNERLDWFGSAISAIGMVAVFMSYVRNE